MSQPSTDTPMSGTTYHFMGIGGIGMSGLASILKSRGEIVDGCDIKANASTRLLEQQGIAVTIGHHPCHVTEAIGTLVYSSAVAPDDPELLAARTRGLRVLSRGAFLAEMASSAKLIGVAGAHGKTTTSGMAAQLLIQAGWDPTVVVGGHMLSLGSNARVGGGRYLVAETDESDGSFLFLHPSIAIVTNVDREHLNHYHTFENLVAAFRQFVHQLGPDGTLIRCYDDPIARDLLSHRKSLSYGFASGADVTATAITAQGWSSEFVALYQGRRLGTFTLRVPGRHNVLNALAVISLGLTLDLPLAVMRDALQAFQGTRRRFQVSQVPGDIWLVDDYAHHPSEIRATLSADPEVGRHRLVVFQPHRFTRTHLLEREFVQCFDRADGVIVTDIYSAFEDPIPGVSGERLAELMKAHGHPCVRYVPRPALMGYLTHFIQPQDTVFFLGAGDIGQLCHELASRLRTTNRAAV